MRGVTARQKVAPDTVLGNWSACYPCVLIYFFEYCSDANNFATKLLPAQTKAPPNPPATCFRSNVRYLPRSKSNLFKHCLSPRGCRSFGWTSKAAVPQSTSSCMLMRARGKTAFGRWQDVIGGKRGAWMNGVQGLLINRPGAPFLSSS